MKVIKKIIQYFKNNYYLATGILWAISLPTYDVWFLKAFPVFGWFALVPVFLYVRDKPAKQVYITAFWTGLFVNFLSYEWIGNFTGEQTSGYVAIVAFLIPALSMFFAVKIFLAEMISREFPKFRLLIYPAMWIFIEWTQTLGYIAFPWVNIGHSQYTFIPFIQSASVIGILGISFIMVMFSITLASVIYIKKQENIKFLKMYTVFAGKALIAIVLLVISITVIGYLKIPTNKELKEDFRVTMVQGCISPWESWRENKMKFLGEQIELSERGLRENPDLLLWSESSSLENLYYNYKIAGRINEFEYRLLNFALDNNVPILLAQIGLVISEENLYGRIPRIPQNSVVMVDNQGRVIQEYAKMILVPFGEWFPYRGMPILGAPVQKIIEMYGGSAFVPGTKREIFTCNGYKFGVLICYEGIFYAHCRQYKKEEIDFFVSTTNDGWTKLYRGHYQHFAATIFRTIENGLWMARVGNSGVTAIIDPFGRVQSKIPIWTKDQLTGTMDFSLNRDTFYSKYADIFEPIFMGITGLLIVFFLLKALIRKIKAYRLKTV